ncbi:MAG: hypothetical protein JO161_07580, partial [Planctomycetaceae bacterium]|nr:hypothetical protein [Planctomycetaceae bacterium]
GVYLPRPDHPLPDEPTRLAFVTAGDFRQAKGIVEALLQRLHITLPLTARVVIEAPLFSPGQAAELLLGESPLGILGQIDPDQLAKFELRAACSAAEIELGVLIASAQLVPRYEPLPPFPPVVRDLSLEVDRTLSWALLSATVKQAAGATLTAIEYLDTFQGGNLPEGRQSVHFSMTFRHPERTLTGEEVDRAVKSVVDACAANFQAKLRG